jgi:hypothetical protein
MNLVVVSRFAQDIRGALFQELAGHFTAERRRLALGAHLLIADDARAVEGRDDSVELEVSCADRPRDAANGHLAAAAKCGDKRALGRERA